MKNSCDFQKDTFVCVSLSLLFYFLGFGWNCVVIRSTKGFTQQRRSKKGFFFVRERELSSFKERISSLSLPLSKKKQNPGKSRRKGIFHFFHRVLVCFVTENSWRAIHKNWKRIFYSWKDILVVLFSFASSLSCLAGWLIGWLADWLSSFSLLPCHSTVRSTYCWFLVKHSENDSCDCSSCDSIILKMICTVDSVMKRTLYGYCSVLCFVHQYHPVLLCCSSFDG